MKAFDLKVGEILRFLEFSVKTNNEIISDNSKQIDEISVAMMDSDEKLQLIRFFSGSNFRLSQENTHLIQSHNDILNVLKNYRVDLISTHGKDMDDLDEPIEEYKKKMEEIGVVGEYERKDLLVPPPDISLEECLRETIAGNLPIDASNPYITDPVFIDKVLAHFIGNEEYEKCSQIMRLKCDLIIM